MKKMTGTLTVGVVGLLIFAGRSAHAQGADKDPQACIVLPKVAHAYQLDDEARRSLLINRYAKRGLCMSALPAETRIAFADNRPILLFSGTDGSVVRFVAHVYLMPDRIEEYVQVRQIDTTTATEP